MARILISAILRTDALIDNGILEMVLKTALEKVFFTETIVEFLDIKRDEDTAVQTGSGKG